MFESYINKLKATYPQTDRVSIYDAIDHKEICIYYECWRALVLALPDIEKYEWMYDLFEEIKEAFGLYINASDDELGYSGTTFIKDINQNEVLTNKIKENLHG